VRGYLSAVKLTTPATVTPLPGGSSGGTTLASGTALWTAVAVNAWGKAEHVSYANGINNRAAFDPQTGRLYDLTAGAGSTDSVVDQRHRWDSVNQLTLRVDAIGDQTGIQVADTFQYDKLGRLTQYTVSGGTAGAPSSRTVNLVYNALGLLLSKSDVGNYSYPAQATANGRPHAVNNVAGTGYTYDLNGNAITASAGKWRTIAYTSFNLPNDSNGLAGC
jgi:RHS Repeat